MILRKAGKIKRKISNVSDEVCQGCTQLWNDECRAYSMPHSKAEEAHRSSGPKHPISGNALVNCDSREIEDTDPLSTLRTNRSVAFDPDSGSVRYSK